jgi:hypothetical protein
MGIMLSTIFSPVIRRPSREITAEIAHPDGMRTCPSLFMMFTLSQNGIFPVTKKDVHFSAEGCAFC